jgi:HNH endonuclease
MMILRQQMSDLSWRKTAEYVHQRANGFCEYCQTAFRLTGQPMHVEHIIPDNDDSLSNLCLSCPTCNLSKGKATQAIDPETDEVVVLFNPRTQLWHEHFRWQPGGMEIVGLTPIGRATVARLRMNSIGVVNARRMWLLTGLHPPSDEDIQTRLP